MNGGIYFHRWGDAPIKTVGATLFVPVNELNYFSNVHYKHQHVISYPYYFDWKSFKLVTPLRPLSLLI
jgi:hypothetical protein